MPLNKMGNFTFKHIDQQDDLYKTKTATEIKVALDSQADELKIVLNALIDSLKSQVVDDSGAENIGIQPITNVTGTNVQSALEDLRLQINAAVAGTIPDGSITQSKLAFTIATDAASTTIADTGLHFTATNVEGALDELFTSANSVKTNVSSAIGLPATVDDTGATLAGYITTEKGRIVSEVGDGSSADSLKYLIDRLIVRSADIATAINAKGVASTSADTLAQMATKIGLISSGARTASGTITTSNFRIIVRGLSFAPRLVVLRRTGINDNGGIFAKSGFFPSGILSTTFTDTTSNTMTVTWYSDGFDVGHSYGSGTYDWSALE